MHTLNCEAGLAEALHIHHLTDLVLPHFTNEETEAHRGRDCTTSNWQGQDVHSRYVRPLIQTCIHHSQQPPSLKAASAWGMGSGLDTRRGPSGSAVGPDW